MKERFKWIKIREINTYDQFGKRYLIECYGEHEIINGKIIEDPVSFEARYAGKTVTVIKENATYELLTLDEDNFSEKRVILEAKGNNA